MQKKDKTRAGRILLAIAIEFLVIGLTLLTLWLMNHVGRWTAQVDYTGKVLAVSMTGSLGGFAVLHWLFHRGIAKWIVLFLGAIVIVINQQAVIGRQNRLIVMANEQKRLIERQGAEREAERKVEGQRHREVVLKLLSTSTPNAYSELFQTTAVLTSEDAARRQLLKRALDDLQKLTYVPLDARTEDERRVMVMRLSIMIDDLDRKSATQPSYEPRNAMIGPAGRW